MLRRMAAELVHLPDIERLSPRVIRILGGNPGKFTLQGTNTYLIGTGKQRLLLDTGEGKPAWLESLKSVLSSESATISSAILTHWHHDHTDGIPDLLGVSPSTRLFKNDVALIGDPSTWSEIEHGQRFETEGATLRALFCPGHTTDHMAFVLEEEDAMFTGDNVLGQGTAVFEDLAEYMKSLEVMEKEFGGGPAYPGHGPVLKDGKGTVAEYIAHRKQREQQILDVLKSDSNSSWTAMEIVKVVYKDYPESLHGPAEGGVKQVLHKVLKDGKVKPGENGDTWRLTDSSSL